jgi:hypothetical protein
VKLASRFGLLEVLPPAREFVGREDSGLLRFGQVPVEEAMHERAIRAHSMWHTGDIAQPDGVEQAGQAAPDPAVFDAVAECVHDLARCLLVRTIDEHSVPVEVEHDDLATRAHHTHHLGQRFLRVVKVHEHALGPAAVERGIGKRKILGIALDELDGQL